MRPTILSTGTTKSPMRHHSRFALGLTLASLMLLSVAAGAQATQQFVGNVADSTHRRHRRGSGDYSQ